MNKFFEPFMWTVCGIAILVVGLSDPLTWGWIQEYWPVMLIVGSFSALSAIISGIWWYYKGFAKGAQEGFRNGEKHAFTWKIR